MLAYNSNRLVRRLKPSVPSTHLDALWALSNLQWISATCQPWSPDTASPCFPNHTSNHVAMQRHPPAGTSWTNRNGASILRHHSRMPTLIVQEQFLKSSLPECESSGNCRTSGNHLWSFLANVAKVQQNQCAQSAKELPASKCLRNNLKPARGQDCELSPCHHPEWLTNRGRICVSSRKNLPLQTFSPSRKWQSLPLKSRKNVLHVQTTCRNKKRRGDQSRHRHNALTEISQQQNWWLQTLQCLPNNSSSRHATSVECHRDVQEFKICCQTNTNHKRAMTIDNTLKHPCERDAMTYKQPANTNLQHLPYVLLFR